MYWVEAATNTSDLHGSWARNLEQPVVGLKKGNVAVKSYFLTGTWPLEAFNATMEI